MSSPDGSSTLSLNDDDADEDRVRAALGLAPQVRKDRSAEPQVRKDRSAEPQVRKDRSAELQPRMGGPSEPQARASRPAETLRHWPGREEVAVTVLPRRTESPDGARTRVTALEAELKAERHERVAAQQALADAQRVVQQLQTKLAHAEMAAAEALQAEQKARMAAEERLKEASAAPRAMPAPRTVQGPHDMGEAAPAKRRGRPPGKRPVVELPEQEPVQWWLPSYAAKAKRKTSARQKS